MASAVDTARVRALNHLDAVPGQFVLYWMQQSQRAEYNHALEYAIEQANALDQTLVVAFGLAPSYPEANLRHYSFMLEGLRDVRSALERRGIAMVVQAGDPASVALKQGRDASLIVCDTGYLRHQKQWRQAVARAAACSVVQVESDVVVPVEAASSKAEWAARTLRPKITRLLTQYLRPLPAQRLRRKSVGMPGVTPWDGDFNLSGVTGSPGPVTQFFSGGTRAAKKRFAQFLEHKLPRYREHRNQPQTDDIAGISPYLHFGQISPVYLMLALAEAESAGEEDKAVFLEELVVRRELSMNFVHFTPGYDDFSSLPAWARATLAKHAGDRRDPLYTAVELEAAATHDPYWNAAMREMKATGFMHNYMRMYWGKKILEWSASPEAGYATTLRLNNAYFLDGRDPVSYANVGWIYGLHDRPWGERPVYGTVRSMTSGGLERKCDIKRYVEKVERLEAAARGET